MRGRPLGRVVRGSLGTGFAAVPDGVRDARRVELVPSPTVKGHKHGPHPTGLEGLGRLRMWKAARKFFGVLADGQALRSGLGSLNRACSSLPSSRPSATGSCAWSSRDPYIQGARRRPRWFGTCCAWRGSRVLPIPPRGSGSLLPAVDPRWAGLLASPDTVVIPLL